MRSEGGNETEATFLLFLLPSIAVGGVCCGDPEVFLQSFLGAQTGACSSKPWNNFVSTYFKPLLLKQGRGFPVCCE